MNQQILLAFRAGQLYNTGLPIKQAFEQAAREELTMFIWAEGLKKYNQSLDQLIASLEAQKLKEKA